MSEKSDTTEPKTAKTRQTADIIAVRDKKRRYAGKR